MRSMLSALTAFALLASPLIATAKTADVPAADEAKPAEKAETAPAPSKKKVPHKIGVQKKNTAPAAN